MLPSAVIFGTGEREWDEGEPEAEDEEGGTREVELGPEEVVEASEYRSLVFAVVYLTSAETILLGAALEDEHCDDQREGAEREDQGPHPVTPAPGRMLQNAFSNDGTKI